MVERLLKIPTLQICFQIFLICLGIDGGADRGKPGVARGADRGKPGVARGADRGVFHFHLLDPGPQAPP